MPIYDYRCNACGFQGEFFTWPSTVLNRVCDCGEELTKVTGGYYPGLVRMRGEGLYPSEQKFVRGTAPFTTRDVKAWGDYNPDTHDMHGKRLEKEA